MAIRAIWEKKPYSMDTFGSIAFRCGRFAYTTIDFQSIVEFWVHYAGLVRTKPFSNYVINASVDAVFGEQFN